MSKTRPPYTAAFRQQMVELVRSGRTPGDLAREFEPSAQAIRTWVAQADRDVGKRSDGLRTEEHEEIRRLRRENRRLREEREILAKATAWFARVMRAAGIAGVSRRRGSRTTRRDVQTRPAPDRVERHFEADAPNRLWVADITYVPTLVGFLYLAIGLDVFGRRVVGWAMATHLRTELVIEALEMAVAQRRPEPPTS